MTASISAAEGALAQGAAAVHTAHGDVLASIKRIDGELSELAGVWEGDAAKAYSRLLDAWGADATKLNATLLVLEDALRGTASDQAATEETHRGTIGGLAAMLDGDAR